MIPDKYKFNLTKLFAGKNLFYTTLCLLIITISGLQIHRFLSKPTISNIKRGDIVSYSRYSIKYAGRVLGLPGNRFFFYQMTRQILIIILKVKKSFTIPRPSQLMKFFRLLPSVLIRFGKLKINSVSSHIRKSSI